MYNLNRVFIQALTSDAFIQLLFHGQFFKSQIGTSPKGKTTGET